MLQCIPCIIHVIPNFQANYFSRLDSKRKRKQGFCRSSAILFIPILVYLVAVFAQEAEGAVHSTLVHDHNMPFLDHDYMYPRDVRTQLTPNATQRTTLIVAGCYIIVIAILW